MNSEPLIPVVKRSLANLTWSSNIIIPYFIISVMPYIPKQHSHSTYSSVILIATQSKHSLCRTTLPARYIHYHYHFARKSWSYILRDFLLGTMFYGILNNI
jgi:hypothetical protein